MKPDAEGNYEVTDVETSEHGEEYTASVEAMCAEAEIAPDEFFGLFEMADMAEIGNMIDYLEEHPEYERIEFMGEMMTKDDLNVQIESLVDALFDVGEEPAAEIAAEEPAAEETAE